MLGKSSLPTCAERGDPICVRMVLWRLLQESYDFCLGNKSALRSSALFVGDRAKDDLKDYEGFQYRWPEHLYVSPRNDLRCLLAKRSQGVLLFFSSF